MPKGERGIRDRRYLRVQAVPENGKDAGNGKLLEMGEVAARRETR